MKTTIKINYFKKDIFDGGQRSDVVNALASLTSIGQLRWHTFNLALNALKSYELNQLN